MILLQNFHLAVIEYLCRGRRAVPLQTFTTRHSIRKLSIVMVLSTTFTQFAPETTKFRKITLNKGHFAVRSRSFKVTDFGTNRKLICDFLLVINATYLLSSTVSEFSHFKCQKSLYITTPLAFKSPDGGVPLGRSP